MRQMPLILLTFLIIPGLAMATRRINVSCIGNSITYGYGIPEREINSYPGQLQKILGDQYNVLNFGVSGATALKTGNWPYIRDEQYRKALASEPDIVLIKLGTNDSKPVNRIHIDELEKDLSDLIYSFRDLPSKPRVILLTPLPCFSTDSNGINGQVIQDKIIPKLCTTAYENNVEIINLHFLFAGKENLFPDKIHPNADGAGIIARRIADLIRQQCDTTFDILSNIAASQNESSFYGYICSDFNYNGANCKVVRPKWSAKGHPWIWRARFWGHEPQTDIALLERGFHLVYCDVIELFGNTKAIKRWNVFYHLLHKAGLSKKVALEGMSRGGVYVYNWAAVNADKVACIYADNPVLDLKSWPSGFGEAKRYEHEFAELKKDYGLKNDNDVRKLRNSPVNKVRQIVQGGYPMLHLVNDADDVVPPKENTQKFEELIKYAKGNIKIIHKPGLGHHPHSLPDPTLIVEFILAYTIQNVSDDQQLY